MHVGQILFVGISTHAPRVGSDMPAHFGTGNDRDFNSRSPCGERRKYLRKTCARLSFQLTLPVWGATRRKADHAHRNADFNSRSPCGERHAPFENPLNVFKFQLTLPVWGATVHETLMTAPPF